MKITVQGRKRDHGPRSIATASLGGTKLKRWPIGSYRKVRCT